MVAYYCFKFRSWVWSKLRFNSFGAGLWLNIASRRVLVSEPIYIDPNEIEFVVKDGEVPYIQGGDWDLRKSRFVPHKSIEEIFVEGRDFRDTTQYEYMRCRIKNNLNTYWCKSLEDVDKYFEELICACEEIKVGNYRLQARSDSSIYPNEILVSVDRNGKYLHERNGSHRLSAARLFGLDSVPVVVIRKHEQIYSSVMLRSDLGKRWEYD